MALKGWGLGASPEEWEKVCVPPPGGAAGGLVGGCSLGPALTPCPALGEGYPRD